MAKIRTGVVTSKTNDKTVTVNVDRMVSHPKYGKRFRVSKKYAVHDPQNQAQIGDAVSIVETKPISKTKTWQLAGIIKTGNTASEIMDNPLEEVTS